MRTLMLLVGFCALLAIQLANGHAAPVPKEAKGEPTPPPQPDETLFKPSRSDYGTVVSVTETKIVLKPVPNGWVTVRLPGGQPVKQLVPIDETPVTYFIHPVMRNGGLADEAYGAQGYRVRDLKVGDTVTLYHELGTDKTRWLVIVSIHDRNNQGPPPTARTSEDWSKIRIERQFARQQRLKAEAEKKDKK